MNILHRLNNITQVTTHYNESGIVTTGKARVTSTLNGSQLEWYEEGSRHLSDEKSIATTNHYVWKYMHGGNISLSHLRRQETVHLVDLRFNQQEQLWQTQYAHLCGKDVYSATLQVSPDAIVLRWDITGPAKNIIIHSTYI